ncbi:class I SAM-dependent methyltransferase [uncultured Roseibium sp.]|uniref:class I SAM-dependent methyltransferase n=1 Tax=uncultured Roseibium sp. TaxID=1936171 RepID=UPI0026077114|nr:class I SAM-dependent methyltransferase [uncultured Roseibium sp.]
MTLDARDQRIPVFDRWFGTWNISVNRKAYPIHQLQRRYDAIAPGWDRKVSRLGFPSAYRSLVRRIMPDLQQMGPAPGIKVLDCGAGSGALSKAFAVEMKRPFDLSVVDISPRMLTLAERALQAEGVPCRLELADIRTLPFRDEEFDLVMCAHTIEHLPDPETALAEALRVLKPGGTLLLVLTRKSLFGAYVHLKWRTQQLSSSSVLEWLKNEGLTDAQNLRVGTGVWTRNLSRAIVGRKASCGNSDLHEVAGPYHPIETV